MAMARSLSEQVGPLKTAASVYIIAGLLCLARLGCSRTPAARLANVPPKYLYGCGALFVAYALLIYLAVGLASDRTQVLEVGLLNYLWPSSTLLLSLVLLDKRAAWGLLPGTALALVGILSVMTQSNSVSWRAFVEHVQTNPAAYGLALAAAVTWALYSNLARRWSAPGSNGAVDLFIPTTGVVLLAVSFAFPHTTHWNPRALVETTLLGAITAVAYALWDRAMRRGDLLLVAACSYFTPLLSTLVSCAYLKVVPGPKLWGGCILLILGSLLSWRSVSDRTDESTVKASNRPVVC